MDDPVRLLTRSGLDDLVVELLRQMEGSGTPRNTVRARERDLVYISAWKRLTFGEALRWPESEGVALRFAQDHWEALLDKPADHPARRVAEEMIALGLRRSLDRNAAATVDRRIASWGALHSWQKLDSPFSMESVRRTRQAKRRKRDDVRLAKGAQPITVDILKEILAACPQTMIGLRDRALVATAWASGGRRRSEIAALRYDDLDLSAYRSSGLVAIRLSRRTKPDLTGEGSVQLTGRAARHLVVWLKKGGISSGYVFRAISKADRVLERGLSDSGVRDVVQAALRRAGYEKGFSSVHGLRSGFLTQAARDGVPIHAAMEMSQHRSITGAAAYYEDANLGDSPIIDLLDRTGRTRRKPSERK